jgi:hypothetical protein
MCRLKRRLEVQVHVGQAVGTRTIGNANPAGAHLYKRTALKRLSVFFMDLAR